MGVTTTSDEKFEEALYHIRQAREAFEACIDKNTWGSGDYKTTFKANINNVIYELRKMELNFE